MPIFKPAFMAPGARLLCGLERPQASRRRGATTPDFQLSARRATEGPPRRLRSSITILTKLTLAIPMKDRSPVSSAMTPTRAERLMGGHGRKASRPVDAEQLAGTGLAEGSGFLEELRDLGVGDEPGEPCLVHVEHPQTRFASAGSRNTVAPLEPYRARFPAAFVPNTPRNWSTFSTVVVARIMTVLLTGGLPEIAPLASRLGWRKARSARGKVRPGR